MKIGDLVKWNGSADFTVARPDTGIVVDGPRLTNSTSRVGWRTTYAVAWFDAKTTFWHNDDNLEILSEKKRKLENGE
jgi:hypothetical protein